MGQARTGPGGTAATNTAGTAHAKAAGCAYSCATRPVAALALLLAATGAGKAAQDAPETPAPAPIAAPAAAPNDPAALALLARAAAAQRDTKPSPEAAPLALQARVQLTWKAPDGSEISLDAERRFLAPDRIWTRAIDTFRNSETIGGFDGVRPWLWSRAAGTRWLDEPGAEADLRQLRQDLELTELLTTAFQLDRLASRFGGLALQPDEQGHGLLTHVLEGTVTIPRGEKALPARLRLWIEVKSHRLFGARLMVAGEKPLQICFTRHQRSDGLDVPRKIEIYVDDAKVPEQVLWVASLSVTPKFTDADFAPPR